MVNEQHIQLNVPLSFQQVVDIVLPKLGQNIKEN
jgi:hypothetical protein